MSNVKIFTDNIEVKAMDQIKLLVQQAPFSNSKIRIMPDVHTGFGCVIGFTGNLGTKVIPNIVGVDIGCGILTIELGDEFIDFQKLDQIIRKNIPSGFNVHQKSKFKFNKLKDLNCYKQLKNKERFNQSLGTLGGGNHFIEIDIDDESNKYLIIHTGSRNLGKQVADYYQKLANEYCIANKIKIPKDLAYLEDEKRKNYLHDMKICQEFAKKNRLIISKIILEKLNLVPKNSFETIHNYISFKDNIVRKGAISAYKDELVLIPINMRDGCIIAKGLGNSDWNFSAPHGAGRIMSRKQAKQKLNYLDFQKSMEGVWTTSVSTKTLDEAPFVYKPIEEIISNTKETIEIIKIIKPIYNFKAN